MKNPSKTANVAVTLMARAVVNGDITAYTAARELMYRAERFLSATESAIILDAARAWTYTACEENARKDRAVANAAKLAALPRTERPIAGSYEHELAVMRGRK